MPLKTSPVRADGFQTANDWEATLPALSPAAAGHGKRSKGLRTARQVGWNLLPPLTFLAIVALWAAIIPIFKIPAYLLPGPASVFSRLIADAPMLWAHSLTTLT